MKTVRVFYRNRDGKDTKVLWWTKDLTAQAQNQYQAYADIQLQDEDFSYQEVDVSGVLKKKVVSGDLVNRDQADIDKDKNKKQFLLDETERQIATILQGKEKATWLMLATKNLFTYLAALQEAAAIQDSSLSAAGQSAKGTLAWIKVNVGDSIETVMANRDAAIAALDVED